MFKTIRNAFEVKELRTKILYTFVMLVVTHFGSQLPIPGVETSFFANWFAKQTTDVFGFFNAMTGGSFSSMFIFALSITPYITSSIIIQLLAIVIPELGELQKDDEDGKKKIQGYTYCTTVGLTLIESGAMAIDFGRQGLLIDYNAQNIIIAIVTMTTGSALLMQVGGQTAEKGVGNGISIVLLFNIPSSVPDDIKTLYYRPIFGQTVTKMIFSAVMIALIILAVVVFVVVLSDAKGRIPVQYSKKMVGRKMVGGRTSNIPLRINAASVIPVILTSSIISFPVVVSQFFTIDPSSIGSKILVVLNSGSWYRPEYPIYSIGLVIYIALLIMFTYFYTSVIFNPLEVANNMKRQGGSIPGTHPGRPTSDYLNKMLSYIVFTGACGLIVITVVPILASGLLNVSQISFSRTSLIIIVSVVFETIRAVESQMLMRYYGGFLND